MWQISDRLDSELKNLIKVAFVLFFLKLQSPSFTEPSDILGADKIWHKFPPNSAGPCQQLALRLRAYDWGSHGFKRPSGAASGVSPGS